MAMRTSDPGTWQPSIAQRRAVALVAERFGLLPGALVGRNRARRLTRPRFAALWVLAVVWPKLSLWQVGRIMGGRDHTTVINGLRRARQWRAQDRAYRRLTNRLAARCALSLRAQQPVVLRQEGAVDPALVAQLRLQADIEAACEIPVHRTARVGVGELLGHHGNPPSNAEILRRREAREEEVRARQIAALEAERLRYGLPRRGRALFEMVL